MVSSHFPGLYPCSQISILLENYYKPLIVVDFSKKLKYQLKMYGFNGKRLSLQDKSSCLTLSNALLNPS